MRGHTETVNILVQAGADPLAKGAHGQTPLQRAEATGNAGTAARIRHLIDTMKVRAWLRRRRFPLVHTITPFWTWQSVVLLELRQVRCVEALLRVGNRVRVHGERVPCELWLRILQFVPRADLGHRAFKFAPGKRKKRYFLKQRLKHSSFFEN